MLQASHAFLSVPWHLLMSVPLLQVLPGRTAVTVRFGEHSGGPELPAGHPVPRFSGDINGTPSDQESEIIFPTSSFAFRKTVFLLTRISHNIYDSW